MKTLPVKEIKIHLDEGVSDEELMRIYGLTPDQLNRLYQELIKAVADGKSYIRMV